MSDVTIKQLAKLLGTPAEKLLAQLGEAGMQFSDPDDVVSNDEKSRLLTYLRSNHGKGGAEAGDKDAGPRQITLRRRKVSELKVSSGSGRGRGATSKTVNVEVRARRTYVKRGSIADDETAASEREIAQQKLRESQELREREEAEREEHKRRREDEARAKAEQQSREEAEALAAKAAAESAAPEAGTEAEATPEEPAAAPAPEAEAETSLETESETESAADTAAETPAETPSEADTETTEKPQGKSSGAGDAWSTPVMPRLHERRKRREKPAAAKRASAPAPASAPEPAQPASAPSRGGRRDRPQGRDGENGDRSKRHAGGKLHLSASERARRSSGGGRRRNRGAARAPAASGAHGFSKPTAPVVREVAIGDANVVSDLAQKMAVKGAEVVKALFKMGVMATINQTIDHDTAELVVEELGHTVVEAEDKGAEATLLEQTASVDDSGEKETRPPVVTIMGHVDHGKTSLLDHIRRTKVASGEAGGITQHIGAYHVTTDKGVITFLDTPGHAAFTSMRARGAQSTDVVVLVVAADDGVKPQTVEAIKHARAANVPLIVAVNKIDKDGANIDNVKQGLAGHEVVPEDWGGDVQFVPLSAKTGQGIDDLLDAISLQAEVMELKAVVDGRASGTVIESRLDRGRGPVATVLVQQGTLSKGDFVVCGIEYGRMRALIDENGKQTDSAGPSIPVQVLGLSSVPDAGDDFVVVADEKLAKQVAEERAERRRETRLVGKANRLEDIMAQMGKGEAQQVLNIVVKADVQGSAEALRESLSEIGNENVKVNVISAGVGGITESDATLASASKALVIGYNVRADASARKVVETNGVDLRYFSIIYDVIDQVTQAASGLLGNEIREDIIGTAEVLQVFRSSKFGAVAGSTVIEGVVRHNKPIRVLRDNTVIFEGELESLRRHKDDVAEVRAGTECGIAVKQYDDVKAGDHIECFERIEVARTL
ncbi:MAG TPA: translation initiation factor IF-2 [Oleiagrimonas sp.]|nr:translation initiation factor IF-2 [Oleiagrimonas sp.]